VSGEPLERGTRDPLERGTCDPLDFRGRRALVTGGSRGLGAVIARTLAARGAHVFLNYSRDDAAAEGTLARIVADGGSGTLAKANLLRPEDIRRLFDGVRQAGGLEILVHNAAIGSFKPTLDVRPNQWDLSMAINARALLLCAREAAALMEGRCGKIVSVSSLGSSRVMPRYGAVGITKAALESLTRYLAAELAPRGIQVNAVSAGVIGGSSIRAHPEYEALVAQAVARTPAGRVGRPEDVANIVVFLCSPLAEWMVGQILVADGGLSLSL
jgi:enoyl-[acyl-carrier protein] reductase III